MLEKINNPSELKNFENEQLEILCEEIREIIIKTVSQNGGHLSSNLGVVELTVALCKVFDFPNDSIVWDVGHQSYPFKILTGRREKFSTIRTQGGISGFPNREESEYDCFTTGHSSTSISSALGISAANALEGKKSHSIAVIGDGALTGGLAYEGLNNAGRIHRNFIVILNDNTMSISKNVGSMARYLTYIRTSKRYIRTKNSLERSLRKLPLVGGVIAKVLIRFKRIVKKVFYASTIFEDMGFQYYGPFDGHNLNDLIETLESVKLINKPVLLHIKTNKGKGYSYAEENPGIYHGLSGFNVETGACDSSEKSFSDAFSQAICRLANEDERICAITAAMQAGTGLTDFRSKFKSRFFDVGIAEGHAVTFAAGLAARGMIPVFAVYSTFLQRSYDQLIHDLSLQNIKAILAIDRAGIVGDDGRTHQGLYDTAYLRSVTGITLYAPSYYCEIQSQFDKLVNEIEGVGAIRYPRGKQLYMPTWYRNTNASFFQYGYEKSNIAIVTYSRIFSFGAEAVEELEKKGINIRLIKLNRIIPIDKRAVEAVLNCKCILFFEEGIRAGGIGESFATLLLESGYKESFSLFAVEDPRVVHEPMFCSLERFGLDCKGMTSAVLDAAKKIREEGNFEETNR